MTSTGNEAEVGVGVLPSAEEQREQVDRILNSRGFRNSEILRNLLRYLAGSSAEHPGRPVKEYEIGLAVLGRREAFDPRVDSSVRVHCSRLRSKLTEYYSGPGVADSVEISIPKGAYHLTARYRAGPAEPEVSVAPAAPQPTPVRLAVLPWAVAALACGIAVWGWWSRPPSVAPAVKRFWSSFDSRPEETLVVFSNPRFVGSVSTGGLRYAPRGATVPPHELHDRYTGTGEAMALHDLTRLFERLRIPLRAKRSGLIAWDEARNRNFIFVGGPDVNDPQTELPRLEQFAFKNSDEQPRPGFGAVINLKPRANEERYYFNSGAPYTHDYAVIGLLPGLAAGRRALVLAGRTTYGTQGAVELLLDENRTSALLASLGAERGPVPFFEALIRVKVSGGVPVQRELVLLRRRE